MAGKRASAGVAALCVLLVSPCAASSSPEEKLAAGVASVKGGDFEAALAPLEAAVEGLTPDLRRRQELSRAYLFLGIAYLELGQELEARGKFREALRNEPKLTLSPAEFSPQVRRVFGIERAVLHPKKKKVPLPLLLVLGGGAATAGVVAASNGGTPPTTFVAGATTTVPTPGGTTTTLAGAPSTTTTSMPPSSSTTVTTTTTLLPGTTTTTTTTSTTTSTTTTTLPSCVYTLGPDQTFQSLGGTGVCSVGVSPGTCAWSVEVFPAVSWLTLTSASSGTGSGSVSYSVAPLDLVGTRSAVIRATQNLAAGCTITQHGLLGSRSSGATGATLESHLDLAGGRVQTIAGGAAFFQASGTARIDVGRAGAGRVEGFVVSASGKPGTWRFDISWAGEPGHLRIVAGQAELVTPVSVVFRLSGRAGERIVFVLGDVRP